MDIERVLRVYQGSDGKATVVLYTELESFGPIGVVAVNLFRAQKCSERAKVYRGGIRGKGSFKNMAYSRKQWAMNNLVKALTEHGTTLGLTVGLATRPGPGISSVGVVHRPAHGSGQFPHGSSRNRSGLFGRVGSAAGTIARPHRDLLRPRVTRRSLDHRGGTTMIRTFATFDLVGGGWLTGTFTYDPDTGLVSFADAFSDSHWTAHVLFHPDGTTSFNVVDSNTEFRGAFRD